LTVAYAAARAVGTIPLMPGGLLVVEAVLVPGLVSSGMSLPSAISALLIYRLISWLLIAAIGWVVFFFVFRTEKMTDSDDDPPTGPLPPLESPLQHWNAKSTDPTETALQGPLPPPDRIPESDAGRPLADS
jgi:putative heme transporter